MRLWLEDPDAIARWVAERIPQTGQAPFGPCTAVGVVTAAGAPLAGVVFHNWQQAFGNIEVSFAAASPRWLTRNIIRGILAVPFDQLGCQRITTLTPKKNERARAFIDAFGFKREGVVRLGFGDDDMIVSGLLKRDWLRSRWMRDRAQPAAPLGAPPKVAELTIN